MKLECFWACQIICQLILAIEIFSYKCAPFQVFKFTQTTVQSWTLIEQWSNILSDCWSVGLLWCRTSGWRKEVITPPGWLYLYLGELYKGLQNLKWPWNSKKFPLRLRRSSFCLPFQIYRMLLGAQVGKMERQWENEDLFLKYNAYDGGPKGHRHMHYTLKKGPISMLRESRFLSHDPPGPKKFKTALDLSKKNVKQSFHSFSSLPAVPKWEHFIWSFCKTLSSRWDIKM